MFIVYLCVYVQKSVDYRGISQSKKFEVYVRATAELKRVDLLSLTRQEKIALFVNIYNALVIHAFVVQGPPNNIWKRFKVTGYKLGSIYCMYICTYLCKVYVYLYIHLVLQYCELYHWWTCLHIK